MYIPNPYFEDIPVIGDLILEHIFVEDSYPILFVCSSKEKKLYLCLCRDNYKKQKWIISEIDVDILSKLIHDEISVYNAFKSHDGIAVRAIWPGLNSKTEFSLLDSCKSIKDTDLPDKDFFLEDEGESENYLQEVKNRINFKEELNVINIVVYSQNPTVVVTSTWALPVPHVIAQIYQNKNKSSKAGKSKNIQVYDLSHQYNKHKIAPIFSTAS